VPRSNHPAVPIAAHLILGPRAEPFLEAMLESISGSANLLIVNDNAPDPSPHAATLARSPFGREDRLVVERTRFTGFADARNVCLRLHAEHDAGEWVAFVDADEVHGRRVARVAARIGQVPAAFQFVDGYTWHFFASFDYYTSIERRMMFFRFSPELRWEGAVHEQLRGAGGRRIALPYVYAHYGHTLQPRRHAEKARQYSSLGAPGDVLPEDQLDDFDVASYYAPVYPRLLRFRGKHPAAGRPTVERLRPELAAEHRLTQEIVAGQTLPTKIRNVARKLNYEVRWRSRIADPLARALSGR
jgi:hypothetical protein